MAEQYSYPLIKILGEGGVGKVYESVDEKGKAVAVKIVPAKEDYRETKGVLEVKELDVLLRLKHPFINTPLDFRLLDNGTVQIVLPLGVPLYNFWKKKVPGSSTIKNKAAFCYQLGSAVHFLHQNQIYHCDLKEENSIVVGKVAKLSDFGFATYLQSGSKEGNCGMTSIMAPPEMFPGGKRVSNKINRKAPLVKAVSTEIWTLGVVFYFALTERIFIDELKGAADPIEIYAPQPWKNLLYRMLDPNPRTRISSMEEVMQDPVFRLYGFEQPARGVVLKPSVKFGLKSFRTVEKRLLAAKKPLETYCRESVEKIASFCISYGSHLSIFALAVDIFYRALFSVGQLNLNYLHFTVFQLAEKIYHTSILYLDLLRAGGFREEQIGQAAVEKAVQTCCRDEINIIRDFRGVLMNDTIYNSAPSLAVVKRCYSSCFQPEVYLKKGGARLCLDFGETASEILKRASKDLSFELFLKKL